MITDAPRDIVGRTSVRVPVPHGRPGPDLFARPEIIRRDAWIPEDIRRQLEHWTPKSDLGALVMEIILSGRLPAVQARELFERVRRTVVLESSVAVTLFRGPNTPLHGGPAIEAYGIVSRKFVTDNGVGLIVDALDNTLTDATIKFHGIGTGTNAENQTDTALQTELTTQYNPDSTRATGTFSQPAANQSRSVATNAVDATVAITEHGVFSQAATGGGTLLDRSVFPAVNMISGDTLATTYTLTVTAGG